MTTPRPSTLLTLNPDGTVSGTRVRSDIYDLFRTHLLAEIPATLQGRPLGEVTRAMGERLKDVAFNAKGSVTWFTLAVKLDLEGQGLIERVPGKGRQRLRRVTPSIRLEAAGSDRDVNPRDAARRRRT